MRILAPGQTKTSAFILLRTLLFAMSLFLVLSIMLAAFAAVMKQSGIIGEQAEHIIGARNAAAYRELNARK